MGGIHLKSAIFMTFHHLGGQSRKRSASSNLATFYALKRKSELVFWGPGPEKCEKAPKSCLFAPKRTFGPEVAFLRKSAFRGPKLILGDSGGIPPNLSKELLLFRAFSGFGRFRDAKITFSWKFSRFHVIFIKKWILCHFTTFRAASWKTPSDFATPLMVSITILLFP